MNAQQLFDEIKAKRSFLCVGLDSDIAKIPEHLLTHDDPVYEFNKSIVDATAPYTVCYKPNLAFYEAAGAKGWYSLTKIVEYIKTKYPKILIIADAKRGDIGNTSQMYARAFFSDMKVDAVTLSPYMGEDTVKPFLTFADKWAVLLALTSNPSASDFEMQQLVDGDKLYEKVIKTSMSWGTPDNTMYVVGATRPEMLAGIRQIVPDHFLLVPGVGAQGGSLSEVAKYGLNSRCGLLVNSSRAIIYADSSVHFAQVAGAKAKELRDEMEGLLMEIL
ncbi:MAG: orotidine-5'-phosphate decarboxylase [Rikenellaceae bacterium]|jgi:orotidine-5'-phosphate decarboxylase|nr:orotidine-5'-phosphate decarboxylase [Rikenellaceae bacterium]